MFFTFGGKIRFPLHKVHSKRTQENSYPSYFFGIFLHSTFFFFFLLERGREQEREVVGRVEGNRNLTLCLLPNPYWKWKNENIQGAHKPFSADSGWSGVCPCENIGRSIPASQAGAATGEPGCLAVPSCQVECIIWLPSKECQLSCRKEPTSPPPTAMQTPPSPWIRPFGVAVRACLVVHSS